MNKELMEVMKVAAENLSGLRKENPPTYWLTVVFFSSSFAIVTQLLLKDAGVVLMVSIAYVLWLNFSINLWDEKQAKKPKKRTSRKKNI